MWKFDEIVSSGERGWEFFGKLENSLNIIFISKLQAIQLFKCTILKF